MNIFVTHPDPRKCAKVLDDKRLIKMILESAQLMSNVAYSLKYNEYSIYKPTHLNHPCSIWARQNRSNYLWLFKHFVFLCHEYKLRFNKIHKCYNNVLIFKFVGECLMNEGKLTRFINCTNIKNIKNVHKCYKLYLNEKWKNDKIKPKWTNSNKPQWSQNVSK